MLCAHGQRRGECIKNSKCKMYTVEQLYKGVHLKAVS